MLVELIMMALVIAYVCIVILGHVLLVAAIYKCLCEDYVRGRRQRVTARDTTPAKGDVEPLPAQ
jgi:hypothetical protein